MRRGGEQAVIQPAVSLAFRGAAALLAAEAAEIRFPPRLQCFMTGLTEAGSAGDGRHRV
jgi:hypothetical protein